MRAVVLAGLVGCAYTGRVKVKARDAAPLYGQVAVDAQRRPAITLPDGRTIPLTRDLVVWRERQAGKLGAKIGASALATTAVIACIVGVEVHDAKAEAGDKYNADLKLTVLACGAIGAAAGALIGFPLGAPFTYWEKQSRTR
jgi:hypothetical protein